MLDRVLGEADGWFSCGELRLIWNNLPCGCGKRSHDCELWRPSLHEALRSDPDLDLESAFELHKRLGDPWTLGAVVRATRSVGRAGSPHRRYAALVAELYEQAARATGARVLVDSSKTALDAYVIAALADVDLYLVHLVRDPRGSAHSWRRRKRDPHRDLYLRRYRPAESSLRWLGTNAGIDAVLRPRLGERYVRVRYEDFTRSPRAVARQLCGLVGEPDAELPFSSETRIGLSPSHTVGGNPIRFSSGELEIRPDEEWRSRMDTRSRLLATIPALPLMPRYGYLPRRDPGRVLAASKGASA